MRRFQTLRGRLTAISLLVAFVAVVGLTIVFNVLLSRELDADARTRLRAQAAAAVATVAYDHGHLTPRETVEDTALEHNIWVFDARGRPVERPTAGRELQRAADALIGSDGAYATLPENVRLYSAAVSVNGKRVGTVVAGQSHAAYDRTLDVALIGSLAFAAVLLTALSILTWMTIGRALDPVRDMTRTAAKWSEHDLDRRFGPTPRPDELGELARTFDALLDRVAASLRHEQRLSAELSHELRTPLARIIAEVELLQRRERSPDDRREAYEGIAHSSEQMSGILETLMATARADARLDHGRAEMAPTLDALASSWEPVLRERNIALDVHEPPPGMYAGVDPEVVERIVAPLLDNAGRYARSRVTVDAARVNGRVVVTVADDGPGVPADARESVFEPGVRAGLDIGHSGAGLGLALARRLARAAGGDVSVVEPQALRGAELRVDLPA
jgi:signal transduction histidine kinase